MNMISSAELILILFGGLTAIFGIGSVFGHITGLERYLDRLFDSMHQI